MTTAFPDHFSAVAAKYAAYRPHYPPALAELLANESPARGLAWDVGCGTGQLSTALAAWFDRVVATDASASQVAAADRSRDNVGYRTAPAEASGLPDGCADLIVAAQAAHWFRWDAFTAEVARVAKPGTLLALVCYGDFAVPPALEPALRPYIEAVEAYWPPQRAIIDRAYADLTLPGTPVAAPTLPLEHAWTRDELAGYLSTWSATQRYAKEHGARAFDEMVTALARSWPDGEARRVIAWPLTIKLARYSVADASLRPRTGDADAR